MEQWTITLLFIYINSMFIFKGPEAQRPSVYIGCYPNSVAKFVHKSFTKHNNGAFCIDVCDSSGYRYAATKGKYCKCANEARFNLYKDDAGCDVQCPVIEHCGGDNRVSLYDTLHVTGKTVRPRPTDPESSSTTGQTDVTGKTVRPRPTDPESSSTTGQTVSDTKASDATGHLMIAVYISLPVGIIVASCAVITMCVILRRHRLPRCEACNKQRGVPTCRFTHASGGIIMSNGDHYPVIDHEISRNLESSTERVTAKDKCDDGYITPIDSNETKENYQHYGDMKYE